MNYSEFVTTLNQNPGKELAFEFAHGLIRKDYHITEVLKIQVEAIDCGGAVDSWKESVLQLVEPKNEDAERFMIVEKALGILEKSHAKIKLDTDAKLILEFRSLGSSAAQRFIVSGLEVIDGKIIVHTDGATTQCKAAERKTGSSDSCGTPNQKAAKASTYCAPQAAPEKKKSACCA
jgi:hypothetical protein